jgi:MFS family permease
MAGTPQKKGDSPSLCGTIPARAILHHAAKGNTLTDMHSAKDAEAQSNNGREALLDRAALRANYVYHAAEGGAYMGGLSFVAPNCVLPRIVELLGAPSWMIGLAPTLNVLGFQALPVVLAHRVERMARVMPLMVVAGAFQRLPYLFAALALILGHHLSSGIALAVVLSAPLLSGVAGGLALTGWQELVAKTVLRQRLSSLFAWRNTLSSIIGIGAGVVIAAVLARVPGVAGYGMLHLICFGFLSLSYILLIRIREPAAVLARHEHPPSFVHNLRAIRSIWLGDRRLRRYLGVTLLTNATMLAVPFMPVFALRQMQCSDGFLGALVTAQMLGTIAGNHFAGRAGDLFGGKLIGMAGRMVLAASFPVAGWLHWGPAFVALFFVQGAANAAISIGLQTMNIELCPRDKRPTYQALISFASLPSMLLFSLGGSVLWDSRLPFAWSCCLSGGLLIPAILLLGSIPEPRRTMSVEREEDQDDE